MWHLTRRRLMSGVMSGACGRNVEFVAAGYAHSATISRELGSPHASCSISTWGWGHHGQLGHADSKSELVPRVVEGARVSGRAAAQATRS